MKVTGRRDTEGDEEARLEDRRFRHPMSSETDHIIASRQERKAKSNTPKYIVVALVGSISMLYIILASRSKIDELQFPATDIRSNKESISGLQRLDYTLGGLLAKPGEFEPASCNSRGHHYHRHSEYKPSENLVKRLRAYEALHRKCVGERLGNDLNFENVIHVSEGDGECRYVVWIAYSGLGNRLMTMTSAFIYSLLTNRVLLIDKGADVNDLFCEPFPGTSWLLPAKFPSSWVQGANENSPFRFGHVKESEQFSPMIRYIHLTHTSDDVDKKFFCASEQEKLLQIPWLLLKSNNYIVPALYFIPSFREQLDQLFPQREAIFHLIGRYLLHPSNDVWGLITRFHRAYLSSAEELVGLQIRTFSDDHLPFFSDQLRHCAFENGLLPKIIQDTSAELEGFDSGKPTAILVTCLQQKYYEDLREFYLAHPTENGRHVVVHQPSHEDSQKTDTVGHDKRAWADIYLLSFSGTLITSPWSTFGYAAQGLAGIKPHVLLKVFNMSQPIIPDPPCVRVSSPEPCLHSPPLRSCDFNEAMDPAKLLPFVQACEDIRWGIKIVGQ